MRLIFATIIGYYLFAEIPDTISIAGTLIIIGGNLYLVFLEGRMNKIEPGARVPGDVT
jgi:hypothetical protein